MAPMDVRTLATFSVAARTLNFTNAALSLGYAQSSVTAQIKSLEEDLGSALFNRVGNRLELTEPGERFLVYAERILALTLEAKASLQDEGGVGTLRFTAPESVCTYLLPPVLKGFKDKFPRIHLQFLPGFVRDFKRQVLDGTVDFAFILEEPFPSKALAVEKIRDEEILIVAAPSHRFATARGMSAQDLIGEDVLLKALGCSYRNQFERQLINALRGSGPGHRPPPQNGRRGRAVLRQAGGRALGGSRDPDLHLPGMEPQAAHGFRRAGLPGACPGSAASNPPSRGA
jgi:DNA-binding transcriptional LysR family regulator